jgi:hypothetical protein
MNQFRTPSFNNSYIDQNNKNNFSQLNNLIYQVQQRLNMPKQCYACGNEGIN